MAENYYYRNIDLPTREKYLETATDPVLREMLLQPPLSAEEGAYQIELYRQVISKGMNGLNDVNNS